MKNKTVLTLSGCGVCSDFKDMLNSSRVVYKEIDANVHASISNRLESLLNVYNYPIVILSDNSNDLEYCYITGEADLLGRRVLPTNDVAYGFFTTTALYNYIKQQ